MNCAYLVGGQIFLTAMIACASPAQAKTTSSNDPPETAMCKGRSTPPASGSGWNGWSPSFDNARFATEGGLKARDVARLKVKWTFAFTGGVGSQPTMIGGRLYFCTGAGEVYALDAKSGCVHWRAA